MKSNVFKLFLIMEAGACILFFLLQPSFDSNFSAVLTFPFAQIGWALRMLSLSGAPGNAAALLIYFALCLFPVGMVLWMKRKGMLHWEDKVLFLLSAVLFAGLYLMINPGLIVVFIGGTFGQPAGKMLIGGIIYSVLCTYSVLRILRLFDDSDIQKHMRYMTMLLGLLNVIFVYIVFGVCFGSLFNSIAVLSEGNSGSLDALTMSYVFLILHYIVEVLPYLFDMMIVFAACKMLDEMLADRYSDKVIQAADHISRLCIMALMFTVLVSMGFNLLQGLFVKFLFLVDIAVTIPIFSIVFILAVLLMARFVAENKQLKDENEQFI